MRSSITGNRSLGAGDGASISDEGKWALLGAGDDEVLVFDLA